MLASGPLGRLYRGGRPVHARRPTSATIPPAVIGCCRSAASRPTWPQAGSRPSCCHAQPPPRDALGHGPDRRPLAAAPGRQLRASPVWRRDTRLVVTFDESRGRDLRSCCGGLGRGGRVATIVTGPRVPRGVDPTPSTNYSLLRSIEAAFGLPFLGYAAAPPTAPIPAVDRSARGAV
jgi:hypothetical protein